MYRDYEAEINNHKQEILKLEAEQKYYETIEPIYQLAITLHAKFCRSCSHHRNLCGWPNEIVKTDNIYPTHCWDLHYHAQWFKNAEYVNSLLIKFSLSREEVLKLIWHVQRIC